MKSKKLLTREGILTAGMSTDEAAAWRFQDALKRGRVPDRRTLEAVARILEHHKFPRRRGRKNTLESSWPQYWDAVLVAQREADGMTRPAAIREVAALTKKTERAIRRNSDRHEHSAYLFAELLAGRLVKS